MSLNLHIMNILYKVLNICELHNPIQEINHANKNDIHIAINRNKMKLSIYISIYQLFTVEYIIRKRKTISRM